MTEMTHTSTEGPGFAPGGTVDPSPRFVLGRFNRRFLLLASFSFIIATLLPDSLLEPVCRFTAANAAALLELFGAKAVVTGTAITIGAFKADVIPECTPLFMVGLFCSFVLAVPAPARSKVLGLLCGIPLLTLLNLVRIALVVATGAHFPALFSYAHVYLGQIAMMFVVFTLCLAWFRSVTAVPAGGNPAFLLRFAAFSSLLFLPWLHLNRWYVLAGDSLVRGLFALFGYQLAFDCHQDLYYQTFNVIGFAALMLASRSPAPARKMKWLCAGFLILFITHVLIRVCNVLLTAFHLAAADKLTLVLSVAGEYLVPVILWLAMVLPGKETSCSSEPAGIRS
jgi:exosortase H (IPTLxxWG-CTERM-specific)